MSKSKTSNRNSSGFFTKLEDRKGGSVRPAKPTSPPVGATPKPPPSGNKVVNGSDGKIESRD